ncbi:hypothetical protein JTB14_001880 [Gonioctena quinquepunctata]|nr:hypothetical protein JTB14_001880 [Gonioctena quinquepunctata]
MGDGYQIAVKHLSKQILPCKREAETKRKFVKKLFLIEAEDYWVRSEAQGNPLPFTLSDLNDVTNRLKTGKALGPDKITPGVLKEAVKYTPRTGTVDIQQITPGYKISKNMENCKSGTGTST